MEKVKQVLRTLRNPAWLCFAWIGVNLGVGLVSTPARFATPGLSRELAIAVGREVFTALNRVELALLVGLLVLIRTSGLARRYILFGAALALIVIIQSAWLLPELAARSDMIVAGETPPESAVHAIYGTLEIMKLGLLLWLGLAALGPAANAASGRG